MKNKTYKKVTWECNECNKLHESYSNKRWDMQVCECGKTGYDLEEFYSRIMGNVKVIKEETFEINDDED
jgi:hypothetical protein